MAFLTNIFNKKNKDSSKDLAISSYPYKITEDTIKALLIGGAIGDALGVPFEGEERDSFVAKEYEEFKNHMQSKGTWSDDTAFTLCQVDNIVQNGDVKDLMDKLFDCVGKGYNAPNGKLYDVGSTCAKAVARYGITRSIDNCSVERVNNNGNGALMRIHPLAVILINNENNYERFKITKQYTIITHNHSRAAIGSYIYIEILIALLKGKNLNSALEEASLNIKELISKKLFSDKELNEIDEYRRILSFEILTEARENIASTGYVVDTLEAVLWCVATSSSYEESVLKAVNLGGDTDTIGSMAGVISSLVFGYESIPSDWIADLLDLEMIEIKSKELYEIII